MWYKKRQDGLAIYWDGMGCLKDWPCIYDYDVIYEMKSKTSPNWSE